MVQGMLRLLFVAAFAFVFLSSAAAEALGLGRARVVGFALLLAGCALVAVLGTPSLSRRGRDLAVACAGILLLLVPFQAAGPLDPLDWKVVLVLLVLFAAPDMARVLDSLDLPRLITALLGLYVFGSALWLLTGEPSLFARGHDGVERWDVSGSLVTHSSLSLLYLLLAGERLLAERAPLARCWFATTAALALLMLFLAATRTTLLVLLLVLLFHLVTCREAASRRRAVLLAVPALPVFALFTLFVSDALWLRLIGGAGDFSSGRAHSLPWWIARALEHPFGLGIGAVRRMLADGRPAIEGGHLLEWPHNEFVRFWVEGGWPGLLFVGLLVGGLLVRTLRFARRVTCPRARLLALAVLADLVAQSLLQNYFNNIYHATVMVAVLAMLLARGADRAPPAATVSEAVQATPRRDLAAAGPGA